MVWIIQQFSKDSFYLLERKMRTTTARAPREPIMLIEENITMCPILITWVKQARGFYYPHCILKDGGHQLLQGYTPQYIISTFFRKTQFKQRGCMLLISTAPTKWSKQIILKRNLKHAVSSLNTKWTKVSMLTYGKLWEGEAK